MGEPVSQVTLNIANSNGRTFTIPTKNEQFINSIVNVKNNTITNQDVITLQNIARCNGDAGILENCDLNGQQKLKLAMMNNYSEYYDIKLSNDGKMFKITVKETPWYTKNPNLATIKSDFGIGNGVLVQKGNIPYGNDTLINKRAQAGSSADGRNTDYDKAVLEAGDTINIPVACVSINGTPRGGFGRFFQ